MSDDRPSIAELQRIERNDLSPSPWESLDHWTPADRAKIALRNAAPVLLEIVAAALRYRDGMTRSEVDTSRCEVLDRALAKVRP